MGRLVEGKLDERSLKKLLFDGGGQDRRII